jgi:hypothetical protein
VVTYHRLLVWDIVKAPKATRLADRLLSPLIGKSLVLYLRKPEVGARGGRGSAVPGSDAPAAARNTAGSMVETTAGSAAA